MITILKLPLSALRLQRSEWRLRAIPSPTTFCTSQHTITTNKNTIINAQPRITHV
jgi:hypothetical protein